MKWISEETLKDCQIFRYSPMGKGKEGVRPVTVDELPGIEVGSDWGNPDGDKTVFLKFREGRTRMECDSTKLKLTREKALELHRKMWTDMQKDLGDCPNPGDRVEYKKEWCIAHGYNICNDCFLCEYDTQHNDAPSPRSCDCLIEWKYGVCYQGGYYTSAPISEILARPEREVAE